MREWTATGSIHYHLLWALGLAVVMAVTGPFGSYQTMGLGVRLVYFTAIGVLAWAQVIGCVAALRRIEAINRWQVSFRMALAGLLAALPTTAEIIVVHSWLVTPISWRAFPDIYPPTAFLTVVISILVLRNGLRVPVSKSFRDQVRDAGWLA